MIVFNSFWIFVSLVVINTNAKSIEIDTNDAWQAFKMEYNKNYSSETEDQWRRGIFEQNCGLINRHNEQNFTYKLKMNQFGDLTHEEFIRYLSPMPPTLTNQNDSDDDSTDDTLLFDGDDRALEASPAIDLRQEGWVSEVKNQGDKPNTLGWAFSLAGAIEAQIFKPMKNCPQQPVQSLSESFLIDCHRPNENEVGTEFEQAMEFVKRRGIYTEKLYKLVKHVNDKCPEEDFRIRTSVRFSELTRKKVNAVKIKKELFGFKNSVPAQVDASHQSFQFYHTGIYTEGRCSTESSTANQAVLIVGYNETDSNSTHWLVKNSWGKTWGEEGYMKIAYRTCGIEKQAYTVLAERKFCNCEEIP